jgi:hypothetical protein
MDRREFSSSAAGATGYSLFVRADGLAGGQGKHSVNDIREETGSIAPPDGLSDDQTIKGMKST